MSDADRDEREMRAAEYVMGTLDSRQSALVEQAMASDPEMLDLVMSWEERLSPLCAAVPAHIPPADMWDRIGRQIRPPAVTASAAASPIDAPASTRRPGRAFLPRAFPWRGWAIGASLVAACLGVLALLPREQAPRIMTVLVSDRSQPAWTAELDARGGLRLATLPSASGATPPPAPEGQALQLWALPPGASAPTSLGLLPRTASEVSISGSVIHPVRGMLIEITLEPAGGSPTGRPTGPVLFIGRLSQAGPAL